MSCDLQQPIPPHLPQADLVSTLIMNLIIRKREPRPSDLPMKLCIEALNMIKLHKACKGLGLRQNGTNIDIMKTAYTVLIRDLATSNKGGWTSAFFGDPEPSDII